jgi:caffeoyl-CoA O-methyltransferase
MPDITPRVIEDYAQAHTTPLPPLIEELVQETHSQFAEGAGMLSGPLVGNFLQTLVATTQARRVLEVGTFTGFGALMMAAALRDDGELITLELSSKHAQFARSFFKRSEHGAKVRLIEGPALESIQALAAPFDIVFIDADKPNYVNYYEAALPLLSEHGVIVADNVLWSGEVHDPRDENGRAIAAFNERVSADKRVMQVMLPVRDGLLLIRKGPS